MPNLTGGKNYKKTKHSSEAPKYVEKTDDQLFGRVLQVLGNRNTLVYCNDNEVRLCHIRGSIRKDMWIGVGDVVLISIRDLNDKSDKYQKGDILHKYDRDYYSKLKKEKGFNEKLLLTLETADSTQLKRFKELKFTNSLVNNDDGDIFDHEDNHEELDDEDIDAI
uniref:S1-like domain-containing protein n=1 Tax=viral metagenome TaxID=1070528 RepID=A0A6C0D7D7_9ZZZZ